MTRAGRLVMWIALLAARAASAQPAAPATVPSAPADPVLAEKIAAALVERAGALMQAHKLPDAKQLAVEAMLTSPHGAAADRARAILHDVNRALGIAEQVEQSPPVAVPPVAAEPQPEPPTPTPTPEATPIPVTPTPVTPIPVTPTPEPAVEGGHYSRATAQIHTGLYTSLLGAMIGSVIDDPRVGPAPTIIGGLAAGGAGAMYLGPLLDRHLDEAQIRTIGSGTVWGGLIGGLMADITTGVGNAPGTSPRQVLIGGSIGATVGGLGGYALASQDQLTRGDIALVDTLAGIGTFAGFSLGFLMQPAQSEAYDLNAVIGATAGVITGLVAAPKTHTPPRRMLRVAEYAGIGGAAPYVLLALIYSSDHSAADERLVGALSTAGLGFGTWLGFRETANVDYGEDERDQKADAPPAIVGRSSDGGWQVGAPGVLPLSRQLDNHQAGAGLTLLSGAF